MDNAIFSVEALCKKFSAHAIPWLTRLLPRNGIGKNGDYLLDVPTLHIPAGVVVLLGPSGAGKSTLLSILAGLDTDYKGTIWHRSGVDKKKLSRDVAGADSIRRKHFSFVFQTSNLLSNLLVRDNVMLSSLISGRSDSDCIGLLTKVFKDTSVAKELLLRYPSQLSGGQRQRVALCRALNKATNGHNVNVLFADEPTANLDRAAAKHCFDLLTDWAREKADQRLLLLATHDLSLVDHADRVIVIDKKGKDVCGITFDGVKEKCPQYRERIKEAEFVLRSCKESKKKNQNHQGFCTVFS